MHEWQEKQENPSCHSVVQVKVCRTWDMVSLHTQRERERETRKNNKTVIEERRKFIQTHSAAELSITRGRLLKTTSYLHLHEMCMCMEFTQLSKESFVSMQWCMSMSEILLEVLGQVRHKFKQHINCNNNISDKSIESLVYWPSIGCTRTYGPGSAISTTILKNNIYSPN